jgi:hypothetical protein
MFGTNHLAALSRWTVGVAAAGGIACMVGSALVRDAVFDGCDQETERSPPVAETGKSMAATPGVETAVEVTPDGMPGTPEGDSQPAA